MQHLINILEWGAIRIFADLLYEAIRRLINIGLILCGGLGKQAKKNAITSDVSKFDSSQITKYVDYFKLLGVHIASKFIFFTNFYGLKVSI